MFEASTWPDGDAVGEQEFRRALRLFASGVTVITTLDETGAIHGMTATAFCSLSLRPPLVLVAIAKGTRCHSLVTSEKRFGVSILHEHQADLSRHFGGQPSTTMAPRFTMLRDVPVLETAMVRLACRLEKPIEGGDHSIITGLVTASLSEEGQPLIHFDGRYHKVAPI